ncbi:MAG: hypothetical protein ABI333_09540 [bacterium]
MHTEYLTDGLQIFAIGFGGVFVNLMLIYAAMAVLGLALRERPKTDDAAVKQK